MNESTFRKHIGKFMKCVEKKDLTSRDETQQYLTRLLFMQKRTTNSNTNSSSIASPTTSSSDAYLTADPEELVRYLCSLAPRQVCQYQFKSNDIVWICKQCQKVLCHDMMMIVMMMLWWWGCYDEDDEDDDDVMDYGYSVHVWKKTAIQITAAIIIIIIITRGHLSHHPHIVVL